MKPVYRSIVLALAVTSLALPARAGGVEVRYVATQAHRDAGATVVERERNLAALAEVLRELGQQRLTASQTIEIELLDVDLTGTLRQSRRSAGEVRIVTGRGDGPRITLRYTLRDAGATIASGQETLHEAALPRLGEARDSAGGDPLRHERALLDHWFVQRFNAAQ